MSQNPNRDGDSRWKTLDTTRGGSTADLKESVKELNRQVEHDRKVYEQPSTKPDKAPEK